MLQSESEAYRQGTEEYENTIDLLELFRAILRHWKMILCAMILCGGAAGAVNYFLVAPSYQANSKIYISNTGTVINIQELQLSDELTVDYEQIILSRTVLKKVIEELNLDMTYQELDKIISVNNPQGSHCLDITVTSPRPETAVEITNCLVRVGLEQMHSAVGHEEPSVIDPAEMDAVVNVKPSLAKYAVLGALLGAVLVCGGTAATFLLDNTVKTEEDVQSVMDLPVLASIPADESQNQKAESARRKGGRHAGNNR